MSRQKRLKFRPPDPLELSPRPIKVIIVLLLVLSLSGLPGLSPLAAAPMEDAPPILRHEPRAPVAPGDTLPIRVVVEDESELTEVIFWCRAPGGGAFQGIPMVRADGNIYEIGIVMTKAFKNGIEYYIEAKDRLGNRGLDGEEALPYFVGIAYDAAPKAPVIHRPWWKSPWTWIGTALVIAGGVYAAYYNKKNEGSGTVIVQ